MRNAIDHRRLKACADLIQQQDLSPWDCTHTSTACLLHSLARLAKVTCL
jgi:hypothetical protein